MDAKNYLKLENRLFLEFGKEKVENKTREIINIVKGLNLDVSPVVLDEFMDYIKQTIHLSKF